ncbi:ATP-dependent Clp protease proteolytic subunit-related protein 3, chloroplastic, variant 2 [Salvia divinorum]|uniref:ATP-dependent Clp protease proteolytic subunit-related protein 3, chloroplastic, variant 2 n=1 Tax=Salvia divinorum TaxID=28513 RepID=A0ABD1H050_SALDI
MANCLRMPMASPLCCSSKRRSIGVTNCANIPMPPINPKDPFLSRLSSLAATSPDTLLNRPKNSDTPPFLDVFDFPTLMATPAQVERSVSYNEHRPRRPPPDLLSLLLHGRIVYIGMPLVPAVTEFIVAELMYLQWMDPKEPIYLYINSTGTTRDDGETLFPAVAPLPRAGVSSLRFGALDTTWEHRLSM